MTKLNQTGAEEGTEPRPETVMTYDEVYELVRDMQKDQDADSASLTSESSFGGQSDIDDDEDAEIRRREAREKWKKLAKKRRTVNDNTLGANFRTNLDKIHSLIKDDKDDGGGSSLTTDVSEKQFEEKFKKKSQFNRMRQKSLHTLAMLSADPNIRLSEKQIIRKEKEKDVAKKRFKKVAAGLIALKPDRKFSDVVNYQLAKKDEADAIKALEDIGENSPSPKRHEILVHHEDNDEPDYTNIKEVNNKFDDVNGKGASPAVRRKLSTDSEQEIETKPELGIPKVENDKWPEEDHYAVAQETLDVLF